MDRRFQLVDVFGAGPFSGNPLAVVCEADGLEADEMQRIAGWLNFSETTFLLPPTSGEADYRVRIFTAVREMPFAGHPTLGSCHAWLAEGGKPQRDDVIVQECGVGLVPIRREATGFAFAAPALLRSGPVEEAKVQEVAEFLRVDRAQIVDAQWGDNGPGWVVVLLDSAEAVLALDPQRAFPKPVHTGVVGPYPGGGPVAFEVRAFFSDQYGGVGEDPVTGSLNAAAAQWLLASGRAQAPYVAAQGTALGRTGRVAISQDAAGAVWVAGSTRTRVAGLCSA